MDRSDSQVISQCNTLKRSILLCIHDEVPSLGTFESCQMLLVCFAVIAFSSLETWPVSELKVSSVKPKRKHCSKRISQEQGEKENNKKSRPFKQMWLRRAPFFLLSPGINVGNPCSLIVSQYGSSNITVFVQGKNRILQFLGNTE